MKIVIHGTNGGYHIFTVEKEKLFDARPDSNKVGSIGQQAYSINYNESNIVFSKYKIIRDVVGDKRTGNVAFSLVIPHTKKLSGEDVLAVLDNLSNDFCNKHIENDNLDNFREDWALVSALKNHCENKLKPNDEELQSGIADPAFLYYESNATLQKYFDSPYQEEYSAYKQIFFVEKNLEGKPENPLNALRHDPNANLTVRIDLENQPYTIKEFHGQGKDGVIIEIWANNSKRNNKDKIKKKDNIRIKYSKNKFYIPIEESGNLLDYKISQYIIIVDENKLKIKKDVELRKVEYNITCELKEGNGNNVYDAEITCRNEYSSQEKKITGTEIKFEGEEAKNRWTVSAKRGNWISKSVTITPENQSGTLKLDLSEHKKVKFNVQGENGLEYNYSIQITNKEIQPKDGEVVFIGEEIDKTWRISVSLRDYETEPFDYCPAKHDNPKYVTLKKRTFSVTGQQPDIKNPGIKGGEIKSEEAILKESWYLKVPKLAWVSLFIAIVASTAFLVIKSDGTEGPIDIVSTEISNKINSYVDGIEMNLDTLKEYKKKHCDSTTFIQSVPKEKSLWQKLWPFGSDEERKTINESKGIPEYCSKIDDAIAIRNAINLGKIDELKGKVFSDSQQNFKNAIDSIVDKYKDKIGAALKADTVSRMNLNQVADLIRKTQNDLRDQEIIATGGQGPGQQGGGQQGGGQQGGDQQGGDQQGGKKVDDTLNEKFWGLVNSSNVQMDSYTKLLNDHKKNGGDIIDYLNKICKNSASFNKFKNIPEIDRKSARNLEQIKLN
jgi:hypothetical protein